ncbi:MAG TPA: site-specific integrase [Ktedonobacteraceae bacterium]|nr:site-specific integrase [Ktedonobacteraceae bacterium]
MKHTMQILDIVQARTLLATAKGHPQEALFVLALATGMRRNELLGLKWQDIDFEKKMLYVRRAIHFFPQQGDMEKDNLSRESAQLKIKSHERQLALTNFGINALKNHQEGQNRAENLKYVFCKPDGSLLHSEQDVLMPFKLILREAGLPNVQFHGLRQSVVTFFIDLGIHPRVVQHVLGMTENIMPLATLSPVSFALQQEALEKLSKLLEGPDEFEDQ